MKDYAIGVDVGGTTVKIGLFRGSSLLKSWEIVTRTIDSGNHILKDIAASVDGALAAQNISKEDVLGLGFAVPGAVLEDGTVRKCVNLGWGTFNVEEEMSKLCSLPVKAGNDANVAALGEMWMGGGSDFNSIVMVTLGTGVGGGIVIDGKIFAGANGAAAEIGHIPVNPDEPLECGCGKHGCLEQYASATGIARLAKEYLEKTDEPSILRKAEYITAKDVFDAAKAGDFAALALVEEFGEMMGRALAAISCVIDPEAFVIGGGVAKAGQIVIDVIKKNYRVHAFHASRDTEFRLATLGNNAGIYGAVKLILQN